MDFINSHLLSLILFAPAAAALVLVALPGSNVRLLRWAAFGLSLIPFGLSIVLWLGFDASTAVFAESFTGSAGDLVR